MSPDTEPVSAGYRPGYEIVAERILAMMASDQLKAGERLPTELQLRERLGVGHTVLREAIKMLVARGHVRVRRGSGIYVADIAQPLTPAALDLATSLDPKDVTSWFECRMTVELQTARLAAERITPRELHALEEAVDLNRRGAQSFDFIQFDAGDNAFHRGIADASHNPFLASIISTTTRLHLWVVEIAVASSHNTLLLSADQHIAILSAIQTGQPEVAAHAMQVHIETVAQAYNQEVRHRLIPEHNPLPYDH